MSNHKGSIVNNKTLNINDFLKKGTENGSLQNVYVYFIHTYIYIPKTYQNQIVTKMYNKVALGQLSML